MTDQYGRTIDYLRVSVTDRCNFRCVYCMPPEGVERMSHDQVIRYEELLRLIRIFSELGVKHIRLTGGEPTARRGIVSLVKEIKALPGIQTVSMTSNGYLLPSMLDELLDDGLDAVNISLDTLKEERFDEITRTEGKLSTVLDAIRLCAEAGLNTKVNCVAMRGVNDDEITEIARLAQELPICVRFIEYMPIGKRDYGQAIYADEIRDILRSSFGEGRNDSSDHGHGPAKYIKPDGFQGSLGIISAMSHSFCEECNRVRMTSDGFLKLCLQYDIGTNLLADLRGGASDESLKQRIIETIAKKPKQHTFGDYIEKSHIDTRNMSSIGG